MFYLLVAIFANWLRHSVITSNLKRVKNVIRRNSFPAGSISPPEEEEEEEEKEERKAEKEVTGNGEVTEMEEVIAEIHFDKEESAKDVVGVVSLENKDTREGLEESEKVAAHSADGTSLETENSDSENGMYYNLY